MRQVCPECGDAGDRGACPRDGTVRVPATDPLLGTVIGSWRVARLLGTGGMGRVYLAVQPAIAARVAIKVLKVDAAADADLVERFFNEARAVNLIRHEGIVDVFDLGRLPDGSPYIVMEHLDGASLGALLRRHRPFPLGTLAKLVGEVLAALDAAHGKAIIHRDLKPDNVFISPGGRVTVLDFGIAKLADVDGRTTQAGSLLGTPAYMAPEQARSQPVDARADVYSAGVMLFEGATGAPPFAASSLYELLDLQVKAQPASPRSKNPEIPEALETVILRALAKDPADRFATATAMREALLASVADLPAAAFAEVAIPPAATPGPPSDPLAPTAATQGSLAHGETMPSEPGPPAKPAPRPTHVQLSRRTVGALAGVALLGLGAAAVMALRNRESSPEVATIDSGTTITRVTPVDGDTITVVAPSPPAVDAAPVTVVAPSRPDAATITVVAPAPPVVDARVAPVEAVIPTAPVIDAPGPRPPRPDAAASSEEATVPTRRADYGYPIAVKNPASVDAFKLIASAAKVGEQVTGGPVELFAVNFSGVDRTGHMDITAKGWGMFHFISVSRYQAKEPCIVSVEIAKGEVVLRIANECSANRIIKLRCTIPQLWQRALDLGMPEDTVLGHINRLPGGAYQFSTETGFSKQILDDC